MHALLRAGCITIASNSVSIDMKGIIMLLAMVMSGCAGAPVVREVVQQAPASVTDAEIKTLYAGLRNRNKTKAFDALIELDLRNVMSVNCDLVIGDVEQCSSLIERVMINLAGSENSDALLLDSVMSKDDEVALGAK